MRGRVKWFSNRKGYGFITAEDDQTDCFVHHSCIEGEGYKSLAEGEEVEFEVEASPKGNRAIHVVKAEAPILHNS